MKRKLLRQGIVAMLVLPAFFGGCSKSENNDNNNGGDTGTRTVYMNGGVFSNTSVTVAVGGTVRWVNDDNMVHTVTANEGTFSSGDMQPGTTFTYTFNTAGTFRYHCRHHAGMTGVVTAVVK